MRIIDLKNRLPKLESEEDYVVVSFDGKGVPMIKAEAAKIVARQGKGEKSRKRKKRWWELRELMWLVDGLEINQRKAHKRLSYSLLF